MFLVIKDLVWSFLVIKDLVWSFVVIKRFGLIKFWKLPKKKNGFSYSNAEVVHFINAFDWSKIWFSNAEVVHLINAKALHQHHNQDYPPILSFLFHYQSMKLTFFFLQSYQRCLKLCALFSSFFVVSAKKPTGKCSRPNLIMKHLNLLSKSRFQHKPVEP